VGWNSLSRYRGVVRVEEAVVNYHCLKTVAFHRMVSILHSKSRTIRIWTNKPVYWDSRVGNLDKTRLGEVLRCPLQHGFNSDSQRGFSVAVHKHTTLLTFVQSVVSRLMSIVHCTAVWTPLRSVVSVNNLKRDTVLFTIRAKKLPKAGIRDSVDFPVSLFVKFVFSPFNAKLFNGDGDIIRLSKVQNFFDNLPASCFHKIFLFMFKPLKIFLGFSKAFIGVALKFPSAFKIFSLFLCYVPSKVKLLFHFRSLSVKDGYGGKGGRANIDTNNKPSTVHWVRKLFFKNNSNLSIPQEGDIFETPSIFKKGVKTVKLIVESNRNYKKLVRRISDFKTWIVSFRYNQFEPSFVNSNRTPLKTIINCLSPSPNVFSSFLNDVRGQKGGFTHV